jgi:thiol-disulfide isomerase/thioredoxin
MESIMTASLVPALLLTTVALGGSSRGVVLDFSATWCGPCQQMTPIVSRLERQGYPIRQVDVDRERELAERFGISSIPAFVLVVDGKEVTRITGATTEEQLRRLLAQIPSDPPPVTAAAAGESTPQAGSGGTGQNWTADPRAQAPRDQRPEPRMLAVASDPQRPEPARSGNLFGRLLGRGEREPAETAPQQPPIVRGNDSEPEEPINLLPIRNPLRASARLHVTIDGQTSVGSGTTIDSRTGRTVVVTCGHLFKDWNETSRIEVDVFTETGIRKFIGRMVSYDVNADVGIVTLNTDTILPTAEVPGTEGRCQVGEAVVNIGCSGGAPPTQEAVTVTALNYFEGPDNVECTGVPVQGRSGGGLFSSAGQLVGVCIGADAERQRGAYAGLLAIHNQLDAAGLSHLYRQSAPESAQPALAAADGPVAQDVAGVAAVSDQPEVPAAQPEPAPESTGHEVATVDAEGEFEVVCVIRDRRNPKTPSKVVIIDRASPSFLSFLGGEMTRTAMNSQPTPTRAHRFPTLPTFQQHRLQDPQSVFAVRAEPQPLFTSPGMSGPSERSRSRFLQHTALEAWPMHQKYVRSTR